jgi:hypothetical protein
MRAGSARRPTVALVCLSKLPGLTTRTPPQLLKRGIRVRPAPLVPASEQGQVALLLSLSVLFEDLRVVRVEDPPRRRLSHAAARLALDARYQATGGAQGVLPGRSGLKARRLAV